MHACMQVQEESGRQPLSWFDNSFEVSSWWLKCVIHWMESSSSCHKRHHDHDHVRSCEIINIMRLALASWLAGWLLNHPRRYLEGWKGCGCSIHPSSVRPLLTNLISFFHLHANWSLCHVNHMYVRTYIGMYVLNDGYSVCVLSSFSLLFTRLEKKIRMKNTTRCRRLCAYWISVLLVLFTRKIAHLMNALRVNFPDSLSLSPPI